MRVRQREGKREWTSTCACDVHAVRLAIGGFEPHGQYLFFCHPRRPRDARALPEDVLPPSQIDLPPCQILPVPVDLPPSQIVPVDTPPCHILPVPPNLLVRGARVLPSQMKDQGSGFRV